VLLAFAGERWGGGAALGVGCGGLLPVVFLYFVMALWWMLGQADLAQDDSGVVRASRRGLEVLGRRLGASLALLGLFVAATLAVSFAFLPVSFAANVALARSPGAQATAAVALMLVQWFVLGVLNVAFGATLIALVRGERRTARIG
jgi:hypothetical protein